LARSFLGGERLGSEFRIHFRGIHARFFVGFNIFLSFIVRVDGVWTVFKNARETTSGNPFGHTHPLRNKFCFFRVRDDRLRIFFKEDRRDLKCSSSENALIGDQVTVFRVDPGLPELKTDSNSVSSFG
jgi:hypothetical protein